MSEKKPLIVRRLRTHEEVHRVDTTPERHIRVMNGLLINMNVEEFYVDDSAFDNAPAGAE